MSRADARQMARGGVGTARFGLEWFRIQHAQGPCGSLPTPTGRWATSQAMASSPIGIGTPYWATDGALLQPIADLQIPILTPFAEGNGLPAQ